MSLLSATSHTQKVLAGEKKLGDFIHQRKQDALCKELGTDVVLLSYTATAGRVIRIWKEK